MIEAVAPTIRTLEGHVHQWLDGAEADMLRLLEELVNIDSGSGDREGIEAVGATLAKFLRHHQVPVERIPANEGLKLLQARLSGSEPNRSALLLGHMDTVFPRGTTSRRPFSRADGKFFGPGVADMKAGLVMNAALMAAFQARLADQGAGLWALFTVDEEVGSRISRPHIEALAKRQQMVLNAEPARANGNIVVARKGGIFIRLESHGVAAHSGVDIDAGASAIEAILHKAQAIYKLGRSLEGVTANVGQIGGGTAINTVPDHAFLLADIRYSQADQLGPIMSLLEELAEQQEVDKTSTQLTIIGRFNPMERSSENDRLAATYMEAARELGVEVGAEATGGCSDAGFPSSLEIPTLCGVGPVGGAAHTANEYVVAASIVSRAKIAASTIIRTMSAAAVR